LGHGEGIALGELVDVVYDTLFVTEFRRLELVTHLIAEAEGNTCIDHSLPLEHI